MNIIYKTKTAKEQEIYLHLQECNDNFIPPLNGKVNLKDYAKKLFEKSVTFEAWADGSLKGLIASYFNSTENNIGYITNVSVTRDYQGKGIASALMNSCVKYAQEYKFNEIILEVHKDNKDAILLYKKHGFIQFENKEELLVMKLKLMINTINKL